uniref:Arrestin_C domain-containing protein n=1 Tax=Caenorhabditis tropicalis TaxID=1561998 RepID=A0A1I7TDN6_9PELO
MAWCVPKIEVDREIYFPGEEVTGKASLSISKDSTARSVELSFLGRSLTAWRVDGDRRNRPVPDKIQKKGEVKHVEIKNIVWTPEDDQNILPAGEYEWKFSFELPKECPASFEGNFGYIRYFVRCHVDVPRFFDSRTEMPITVSPTIDLNSIPGARDPIRVEIEKISQKCACLPFFGENGNISYVLSSPRLGYVSGDYFNVDGMIENHSTKSLNDIEATFKRRVIYMSVLHDSIFKPNKVIPQTPDPTNSRKEEWIIEQRTEVCEIAPGKTKNFSYSFCIPPVVSTIRSSSIISVEYLVTINGDWQFCDRSTPPTLNIIVGNVPLLEDGKTTREFLFWGN